MLSNFVICDLGEIVAFMSAQAECRKGYFQIGRVTGTGSVHGHVHMRAVEEGCNVLYRIGEVSCNKSQNRRTSI